MEDGGWRQPDRIECGDELAWPDLQQYEAKAHRLGRLRKEGKSLGFELKELDRLRQCHLKGQRPARRQIA